MRLLFLLSSAAVLHGAQPGNVNVREIIEKSVAVTEADWKEAPKYAFTEHDIISKRDNPKTTKTYEVLMIDGSPYDKLIEVGGRALTKSEQQAEDRKLQAEIYRRQHESARDRARRIAKYQKERAQDHAMMREMAAAFNYRLVGEPTLNGRETYEFQATPKPGYVPRNRETKVLPGMKGTLWVDKETCQWVKVEAEVVRPVSFFGFVAKVGPGTRFELEQEPITSSVWLPKHFAVRVNASVFGFFSENSTDDETYRDYRPMTKALEAMR